MKPSHLTTPRQQSDCWFPTGNASIQPMAHREADWEKLAGYALAFVIGIGFAAMLFFGWSK
jgi:hypothetical protein